MIGRRLRYVDVPDAAARDAMSKQGMPSVIVDGMLEFMQLMRGGGGATVTDAVEVTGRRARSFETWVRDHVEDFR